MIPARLGLVLVTFFGMQARLTTGQSTAIMWEEAGDFNYTAALQFSLLFYEAQRSGKLPADQRVTWRGDSLVDEQGRDRQPLDGGYYDAGDGLKITHPLSVTLSIVAWSVLEFKDSYVQGGQYEHVEDMLRWGLDWLLKAHYAEDKLVIQIGSSKIDHKFHGPPERMGDIERPIYVAEGPDKPASDVAALAAAALAAGSIVFEDDQSYQRELLAAAKSLYTFAVKYRGKAVDWLPASEARLYNSSHVEDDMMWAACWLFKATLDGDYYRDAKLFYNLAKEFGQYYVVWNWDNMYWGAITMLQKIEMRDYEQEPNTEYQAHLNRFFASWMEGDKKSGIQYLSEGFACIDIWGVNRETANAAALAYLWGNNPPDEETARGYRCWAQAMLDWMLGRNARGQSYMVGWNEKYPTQPHHRGAACADWADKTVICDEANFNKTVPSPHVLYGGMVMGRCGTSFPDIRTDYETAEVALDVNAGLTAALSALVYDNRCYGAPFKAPAPGKEAENHLPPTVANSSTTVSGSVGSGNMVDPTITAAALAQAAAKLGAKLVLNDDSGTISTGGQIVSNAPASASFGEVNPFLPSNSPDTTPSLPWLASDEGSTSDSSRSDSSSWTNTGTLFAPPPGSRASSSSGSSSGALTSSQVAKTPDSSSSRPLTVATPPTKSSAGTTALAPAAQGPVSVLAQIEGFTGPPPPQGAPAGPDANEVAGMAQDAAGKQHQADSETKRRQDEAAREAKDRETAAQIDAENRLADAQRRGLPIPADLVSMVQAPPPPDVPMQTDIVNGADNAFQEWSNLQDIVNGRRLRRAMRL